MKSPLVVRRPYTDFAIKATFPDTYEDIPAGDVPLATRIVFGEPPFTTYSIFNAHAPGFIKKESDGWFEFKTETGKYIWPGDTNLRSELFCEYRLNLTGDLWMMSDILWDGTPPPDWACFIQTHNNNPTNPNNPPNPVFNIESYASNPSKLFIMIRTQDEYPSTNYVQHIIGSFDIIPNKPFRVVMYGRMTNGKDGGIARVWVDGSLVASYYGPMGYPIAPEDSIGLSPHFGIYRGVGADEAANPITYSIKQRNMYAGFTSLIHKIGPPN